MILEEIKSRTALSHLRVEQSALMRPIADQTLTPEKYAYILRKFYGFFQPLEDMIGAIEGVEQVLPDVKGRRKASLLLQDLQVLGLAPGLAHSLPLCQDLPEVSTPSQAMGCLYVMEGSTLGGKFISKQVQEALGLRPEGGTAFFSGYGKDTGSRWKDFRESLVRHSEETAMDETIIGAAEDTFLKLEQWFSQK
jgi:heme oxygenase (biliverdin-IX-beta and delta-forming)